LEYPKVAAVVKEEERRLLIRPEPDSREDCRNHRLALYQLWVPSVTEQWWC